MGANTTPYLMQAPTADDALPCNCAQMAFNHMIQTGWGLQAPRILQSVIGTSDHLQDDDLLRVQSLLHHGVVSTTVVSHPTDATEIGNQGSFAAPLLLVLCQFPVIVTSMPIRDPFTTIGPVVITAEKPRVDPGFSHGRRD